MRTTWRPVLLTTIVAAVAVAGCGGGKGPGDGAVAPRRSAPTAATEPVTVPPVTAAPSPVDRLVGVGDAQQVIAVIADREGDDTATLTAYERVGVTWNQVFGPWSADIGRQGFAPTGQKREGDLRTPTGAYGFDFAFGVLPDPGVRLPYRQVTSDAIVWDDDPASARYNLWTDATTQDPGDDPEPMFSQPAYNYGAVIAYNVDRTPGLGSAIFLHVSKDRPTAGCVAVPQDQLLELLRWLDPARAPRIVMGTPDAVSP